jgi:hypothetical protein
MRTLRAPRLPQEAEVAMAALPKAAIEGLALLQRPMFDPRLSREAEIAMIALRQVIIEGLALRQHPVLDPHLPREAEIAMVALLAAVTEGLQHPVLETQIQPAEPVHPLVARPEVRFLPIRHTTGAQALILTTSQQHPNLKRNLLWRPLVECQSVRA